MKCYLLFAFELHIPIWFCHFSLAIGMCSVLIEFLFFVDFLKRYVADLFSVLDTYRKLAEILPA